MRNVWLALLGLTLILSSNSVHSRICNALVLEAGGDKGSYEAGVIHSLVNNATNPQNRMWDVVSGVSVGSILTGFISQFELGDEVTMANELVELWQNIQSSDIYKTWPGGIIQGILYKTSIFDESPIQPFLAKYITETSKRRIAIASTNIDKGEYTIWNETLSVEDLRTAIRCSSAFPVGFPYVNFQGTTFVDGAVLNSLNIASAVERCREIADNDSEIFVDSILVSNSAFAAIDASKDSALSILMRTYNLLTYAQNLVILTAAESEFPKVNFRYTVSPSTTLPTGTVPLGFKSDEIEQMITMGKTDGLQALEKGEGVSHKELLVQARSWLRNNRRHIMKAAMKLPAEIAESEKILKDKARIYEQKLSSFEL